MAANVVNPPLHKPFFFGESLILNEIKMYFLNSAASTINIFTQISAMFYRIRFTKKKTIEY